LAGASGASRAQAKDVWGRILKKYGSLILASVAEMIFGIEFLPIETFVVWYMYWRILQERQEDSQ
jgi:hypothetical protein